jgi:hypothetical protein
MRVRRTSKRGKHGQAMLEYSLLTWILTAAIFVLPFVGVPTSSNGGGTKSVFYLLMQSYQIYNNSYYFALCAPLP